MDYQGGGFGSVDGRFAHPYVAFFHLIFRISALVVYLIGSVVYSASFIGIFVSVVLLLSIDFWTVKNVTGRILVKLFHWIFDPLYFAKYLFYIFTSILVCSADYR